MFYECVISDYKCFLCGYKYVISRYMCFLGVL